MPQLWSRRDVLRSSSVVVTGGIAGCGERDSSSEQRGSPAEPSAAAGASSPSEQPTRPSIRWETELRSPTALLTTDASSVYVGSAGSSGSLWGIDTGDGSIRWQLDPPETGQFIDVVRRGRALHLALGGSIEGYADGIYSVRVDGTARWESFGPLPRFEAFGDVTDGTIHISDIAHEKDLFVDSSTGAVRWSKRAVRGASIGSSTVCGLVGDGPRLVAFDEEDGGERWHYSPDVVLDTVDDSTVTVHGDTVYVRETTTPGPSVTALDIDTGERLWQTSGETMDPVRAFDRTLLVRDDGLTALDTADGDVRWQVQTEPKHDHLLAVTENGLHFVSSSVVTEGDVVSAIERKTGEQLWRRDLGVAIDGIAAASTSATVYLRADGSGGSGRQVIGIDRAEGGERWRFGAGDRGIGPLDEVAFYPATDAFYVRTDDPGAVYALDG